jgi:hypothetical protein
MLFRTYSTSTGLYLLRVRTKVDRWSGIRVVQILLAGLLAVSFVGQHVGNHEEMEAFDLLQSVMSNKAHAHVTPIVCSMLNRVIERDETNGISLLARYMSNACQSYPVIRSYPLIFMYPFTGHSKNMGSSFRGPLNYYDLFARYS